LDRHLAQPFVGVVRSDVGQDVGVVDALERDAAHARVGVRAGDGGQERRLIVAELADRLGADLGIRVLPLGLEQIGKTHDGRSLAHCANQAGDSPWDEVQFWAHVEIRAYDNIARVPEAAWNALLDGKATPFLRWQWLEALETSGCATPATGWQACHLTL